MNPGPLSGVVVVDVTTALAGPFSTMVLGDLGADVLKIEMPGSGDGVRKWGPPFIDGSGATYIGYNRNKRSVAIDLHTAKGRSLIMQLAAKADVVVENFRPGTMKKFGLAYEVLREQNPGLIYCSISGYGQDGPMAQRPAMDLMIQAVSGMMSLTGEPEGRPVKGAAPISDLMGGFCAAFTILAAIRERDKTGEGRAIDVSMLDCMMTILGQSVTAYAMSGEPPRRLGNAHALMAPYESFRTATRDIVISLATEKRWEQLCTMPEFAALRENPRYGSQELRNRNRGLLCPEIQAIFVTRSAGHWLEKLQGLGLPAAPVNELPEILAEPHLARRGTLMEVEYPSGSGRKIRIPGMPWRDVAARGPVRNPPRIGEHTGEVFAQFGIAEHVDNDQGGS